MRISPALWVTAYLTTTTAGWTVQQSAALTPEDPRRVSPLREDPASIHKLKPKQIVKQKDVSADEKIRIELRKKINSGLVGIVLGLSETDSPALIKLADFFSGLEGDDSRIFQIGGKSASQNVIELSFARGIDAGIIQSDILDALKHKPPYPGVETRLQYVATLYDKPVHLFAASDINSIEELRGKKVNFGPQGSDNFLTATKIFDNLGIAVEATSFAHTTALEKVRSGEIAALLYVAPKPADLFNLDANNEKLHFIAIPPIDGGYTATTLEPQDYYQLLEQPVKTVAVGEILMVYNWPQTSDRYKKVTAFVRRLLNEHVHPGNPPAWPEVNLTAALDGWTRFGPAMAWMQKHGMEEQHAAVPAGASPLNDQRSAENSGSSQPPPLNHAQRDQLFREFVVYEKRTAQQETTQLFADFQEYMRSQQERLRADLP